MRPHDRPRRPARLLRKNAQSGMASVWAVSWIAVCVTVGWFAVVTAAVEARQHQVDGAADLVSLSAASRLQHGGDACTAAAELAAANDVLLTRCHVNHEDVEVTVRTAMDLPFGMHRWIEGRARAGPV